MKKNLDEIRTEITKLDRELLHLLATRRALTGEVALNKSNEIKPVRDQKREKELLAKLVCAGNELGLESQYVLNVYKLIIEDSVLNQQAYLQQKINPTSTESTVVAYLGPKGSYSSIAAYRYCNRHKINIEELCCESFINIINAIETGRASYGFLPIENTSSGSINEVYDLLQHTSLAIVGEITIPVEHCLLVKPGTKLEDIKAIYSHPQPISQCSSFLAKYPNIELHCCISTGEAMAQLTKAPDNSIAVIGSEYGGELYNLEVIARDLANQTINQSRFIVVHKNKVNVAEQVLAKCTLIMKTEQKAGALVDALLILKEHNLNMCKLESRPITGTPWEEMFYMDIEANVSNANMQDALQKLDKITTFIKVLGCYPIETVNPTKLFL